MKDFFQKLHRFKPQSSRSESSELYLVGFGFRQNEETLKKQKDFENLTPEEQKEHFLNEKIREYKRLIVSQNILEEEKDKFREEIEKEFNVNLKKMKFDPKEMEELSKIVKEEEDQVNKLK